MIRGVLGVPPDISKSFSWQHPVTSVGNGFRRTFWTFLRASGLGLSAALQSSRHTSSTSRSSRSSRSFQTLRPSATFSTKCELAKHLLELALFYLLLGQLQLQPLLEWQPAMAGSGTFMLPDRSARRFIFAQWNCRHWPSTFFLSFFFFEPALSFSSAFRLPL